MLLNRYHKIIHNEYKKRRVNYVSTRLFNYAL